MTAAARHAAVGDEAAFAERWAAAPAGPLRLEDGRALRIVFPGVPGGGAGPDFRDAILDASGDLLRGDVEIHLRASGWHAHGHARDPAYGGVILHVVAANDLPGLVTYHASGRAIPLLVLPWGEREFPPPFAPPCVPRAARGQDPGPALDRLGARRQRMKVARIAPFAATTGAGQALYTLVLETLAGPANRAAFGQLARRLPLAALLERADGAIAARELALAAELRAAAGQLALRRAGLRPMASPEHRIEVAAALCARLWPAGAPPAWPAPLAEPLAARPLLALLRPPGAGRGSAIELAINAVLPVAAATGAWPEAALTAAYTALPSPGTYGKLRRLDGWLGAGGAKPFRTAARLQGGLLLHADYCAKGACGRCPMSED